MDEFAHGREHAEIDRWMREHQVEHVGGDHSHPELAELGHSHPALEAELDQVEEVVEEVIEAVTEPAEETPDEPSAAEPGPEPSEPEPEQAPKRPHPMHKRIIGKRDE